MQCCVVKSCQTPHGEGACLKTEDNKCIHGAGGHYYAGYCPGPNGIPNLESEVNDRYYVLCL